MSSHECSLFQRSDHVLSSRVMGLPPDSSVSGILGMANTSCVVLGLTRYCSQCEGIRSFTQNTVGMDITGWVEFIGEIAWRVSGLETPANERDRSFWHRTLGLVGFLLASLSILLLALCNPEIVEALVNLLAFSVEPQVQLAVNVLLGAVLVSVWHHCVAPMLRCYRRCPWWCYRCAQNGCQIPRPEEVSG